MKTRTKYIAPEISIVNLDNGISLELQSTPPEYESNNGQSSKFNFETTLYDDTKFA